MKIWKVNNMNENCPGFLTRYYTLSYFLINTDGEVNINNHLEKVKQYWITHKKCWTVSNSAYKQTVAFKIVKKFPMNETNLSEIDLADQNQDEYKYLRTTSAFIIEGVLLPILATFGIVGKFLS